MLRIFGYSVFCFRFEASYEIILGSYSNTKVSLFREHVLLLEEEHPDLLHCDELRRFWISWNDSALIVWYYSGYCQKLNKAICTGDKISLDFRTVQENGMMFAIAKLLILTFLHSFFNLLLLDWQWSSKWERFHVFFNRNWLRCQIFIHINK